MVPKTVHFGEICSWFADKNLEIDIPVRFGEFCSWLANKHPENRIWSILRILFLICEGNPENALSLSISEDVVPDLRTKKIPKSLFLDPGRRPEAGGFPFSVFFSIGMPWDHHCFEGLNLRLRATSSITKWNPFHHSFDCMWCCSIPFSQMQLGQTPIPFDSNAST